MPNPLTGPHAGDAEFRRRLAEARVKFEAAQALDEFMRRHADEEERLKKLEPPHCEHCFEGCERCNWGRNIR